MKKTVTVQQNNNTTYITIPKAIKEKLNIKKGDTLLVEEENGNIIIKK